MGRAMQYVAEHPRADAALRDQAMELQSEIARMLPHATEVMTEPCLARPYILAFDALAERVQTILERVMQARERREVIPADTR